MPSWIQDHVPTGFLARGLLVSVTVLCSSIMVGAPVSQGRIVRAICLGDVVDQYGGFNSFVVIRDDPAIATTLVPSRPDYISIESATRNLRVYMPRTYESYLTDYDATLMSDCDKKIIRPEWVMWMADSVLTGGLGFLWLGSLESQDPAFESWEGSVLAEIAPIVPHPRRDIWGSFRLVDVSPGEPLMMALPWDESPPILHFNTQIPKLGSSVLATTDPYDHPIITTWSPGAGMVLSFSGKFPRGMEEWARQWRFFPQAMIYMTYQIAGRELPPDPMIFERLIRSFRELREGNAIVISIVDFAEKFGAKVDVLHSRLVELMEDKGEAADLYVASDYDEALSLLESLRQRQLSLVQEARDAKDRALFWIYVAEWLTILGTFMLSGSILWTTMVRRRFYREARISAGH